MKSIKMKSIAMKAPIAALALLAASTGATFAASVTGTVSGPFTNLETVDLSAYGTLDWAYWADGNSSNVAATNSKRDASLIGNLVAVGNTASLVPGGSATKPALSFTYTDGVLPQSGTAERPGLFNNATGVANVGVGVSIDLPTTDTYLIYIWVAAFNQNQGDVVLTASFGGEAYYTDSSISYTGAGSQTKDSYLYTLTATADNIGDTLDIKLVNQRVGNFANVSISAVAVAPIPEPATGALAGAGIALALGVMKCVRRKRHS